MLKQACKCVTYMLRVRIHWKQTLDFPTAEEHNNHQVHHQTQSTVWIPAAIFLMSRAHVIAIRFHLFSQVPCYLGYWLDLLFKIPSLHWVLKLTQGIYRRIYYLVLHAKSTFLIDAKNTFIQRGFHQSNRSTLFYKLTVNVIFTFFISLYKFVQRMTA